MQKLTPIAVSFVPEISTEYESLVTNPAQQAVIGLSRTAPIQNSIVTSLVRSKQAAWGISTKLFSPFNWKALPTLPGAKVTWCNTPGFLPVTSNAFPSPDHQPMSPAGTGAAIEAVA